MTATVTSDIREAVAWITIQRPSAGNALRGADVQALSAAVRQALADTGVRVLVISGEGDKFFCTGGDLSELAHGLADIGLHIRKWHDLVDMVEAAEKPVIAALNGHAVGGGLELALACHQRIASARSRLGVPELNAGLFPSAGGVRRLTRLLGASTALELTLSTELWTAQTALARGLVNRVCEPGEVLVQAGEMASRLSAFEPNSLRAVLVCARTAAFNVDTVELEISLLRECYQTEVNRVRLREFQQQLGRPAPSSINKESTQ